MGDALQRGIDRGELDPDLDFAFISDLLTGPPLLPALVQGERLHADNAQ